MKSPCCGSRSKVLVCKYRAKIDDCYRRQKCLKCGEHFSTLEKVAILKIGRRRIPRSIVKTEFNPLGSWK
jgi:transcriptional regulator NrdR family protein